MQHLNFSQSSYHHLPIIGYHHSPMMDKFGIPRQPNLVALKSHIEFVTPFDNPDAFLGIEQYSHLWVLWQFHQNKSQPTFHPKVRPPRLGGNEKMGVFATRSMYRPSNIGLSVVQLDNLEINHHKAVLHIIGADMVDKTPILDIKPYIAFADNIANANSGYMQIPSIKIVTFHPKFNQKIQDLILNRQITYDDVNIIEQLVAQDPRPAYRQHEVDNCYFMRYKNLDIGFFMNQHHEMVMDDIKMIDLSK